MRLNYVGRRTLVAMGIIAILALLSAAFGRQPSECARFGTGTFTSQIKRPALPACLETLRLMKDETVIGMCKSELTAYVDDMDQYSRCLSAENKDAIREGNEAIEKFNCIARGQSICY